MCAAIMWASQANTVYAAFWTLLYLLRDPRACAELLEEVRSIAGDSRPSSPGKRMFSKADLKSMVKLDSAITEMNSASAQIENNRPRGLITPDTGRPRLTAGRFSTAPFSHTNNYVLTTRFLWELRNRVWLSDVAVATLTGGMLGAEWSAAPD
jgi:hypothetical protein